MSSNKVLFLFDVDGTLTVPRQSITDDMKQCLRDTSKKVDIAVVGGSDLSKITEQLGDLPTSTFLIFLITFNIVIIAIFSSKRI